MKNNILKYFILLLSVLVILTVYLSIVGIETDKFNDQIKKKINQINTNLDVDATMSLKVGSQAVKNTQGRKIKE